MDPSREATMSKPIDYDKPRRPAIETDDDGLDALAPARAGASSPSIDLDGTDAAERFELPGADLSDEELTAPVVPMQADEFRCVRCFLVHHRSQLADPHDDQKICRECS
jgi:hypothetical protein